jgi:arginase family enzyme
MEASETVQGLTPIRCTAAAGKGRPRRTAMQADTLDVDVMDPAYTGGTGTRRPVG